MDSTILTSDDDLIAAIRLGRDREALEQLVRKYLPQVRSIVLQMTLSDATADDVTQEVFLRAIRGLSGFNGRAKFSTWLYRIAKNTAQTHLQQQSRSRTRQEPEKTDGLAAMSSPDRQLLDEELSGQIEQALRQLTPALRAAIVLTALQGLSPAEAADVEQCSAATMYWRIHEARKQLRRRLKEHLS